MREMKSLELGVDGGLSFFSQPLGTFPSICGPQVPGWTEQAHYPSRQHMYESRVGARQPDSL